MTRVAARCAAQERESVAEPSVDLGRTERAHLGGRQLEREGHAVEPSADGCDSCHVVVAKAEVCVDRGCSLDE
jgi:hypothetical protein